MRRVTDILYYALSALVMGMLLFALIGCASHGPDPRLQGIHDQMRRTFTYVDQSAQTDVLRLHDIGRPWQGDCDDFSAVAAYYSMAVGIPAHTKLITVPEGLHMVTVADGWVFDNRHDRLRRASEYGW